MKTTKQQSKPDPLKTHERNCACFNIRKAARSITQFYEDAMRSTGLRATQYTILSATKHLEPITVMALAEEVVTDRTTLTRNLKVLEKHGLIRLEAGEDRRERQICLTDKGRKAQAKAYPLWKTAQEEMIHRLGDKNFTRLLSDLSRVVTASKPH